VTDTGEAPCFNLPVETPVRVFLGLGRNVGDRGTHLANALRRIDRIVCIEAVSSVYQTEPIGFSDQQDYWNLVASATTDLPALQLMHELLTVEGALGRDRSFKNAPRTIDIDLLLYDDVIMKSSALELPHPRMHERAFVLRPLLEIAPEAKEPGTGERYADLLTRAPRARVVAIAPPLRVVHETN
jgi:2-amino-4-hydroxy-6-hydroxymethyldihydropteridine diphosphokinase